MEINKEFFEEYGIKKLIEIDEGKCFAFYLKMLTSDFFYRGNYKVVEENTAAEQLAIEFGISIENVNKMLDVIDEAGLIWDYNEEFSIALTLEGVTDYKKVNQNKLSVKGE